MAKAVADTNSESNQGGFTTDNTNITGFSSMRRSFLNSPEFTAKLTNLQTTPVLAAARR